MTAWEDRNPKLAVDVIIELPDGIVLIERKNERPDPAASLGR